MTAVPQITFGATGFVPPSQAAILAGVQTDYSAAFGVTLNFALETPQGQLTTSTAAVISDNYDQQCALFNGVDPAYASGRLQDAIGRIYFQTREPATSSVVTAICGGLDTTVLPAGLLARDTAGNVWVSLGSGTITGGSVSLSFACQTTGPIACPAGSLNTIYQAYGGWESITNPADAVLGTDVESREAFEERRQESVAVNAVNSNDAIFANVLAVAGVLDAYVTDNSTGAPLTIGDYTIAPGAIYVCAAGGTDLAVATAIYLKKPPGTPMSGNTTVTVTSSNPAYVPPLPTYQIIFERPATATVMFAVTIKNSPSVPSNALALVQAAIIAAFAGADGGPRARIASTIFASRYYPPIAALGSWAQQIVSILIGIGSSTADTVTIGIDQVPATDDSQITLSLV